MPPGAVVSVVVRTHDSERTLRAALEGIRTQSVPAEIVVVDSGSTDGTLDMAASVADHVVHLAPGTFSFGRALNRGIEKATGDVVFALSSHVVPPGPDWLERSLEHHADPAVVATCGAVVDPGGRPLTSVIRQDIGLARAHPLWGLTNTAASWRASLVREHPFDESLEACEDKEWALRVLAHGGYVVVDPRLALDGQHRKSQGLREYFERLRRERRAMVGIGALPRRSARSIAAGWVAASRTPPAGERGFSSVTRLIDHLAEYAAVRDVSRAGR